MHRLSIAVAIVCVSALASAEGEAVSPEPAPPDEPKPEKPEVAPEPKDKEPEPPAAKPEAPKFTWEPYGFLRMQYRFVQDDDTVEFVGRDDGFELQNARVGIRGSIPNSAAFTVSIDGAVDERTKLNQTDGRLRVGLRDAYVDFALATQAIVRGGYFQPWAEPEVQVADTAREFVDKPIESRGVRPTEGFQAPGLTPGRSIGAAIRYDGLPGGKRQPFAFELALQNGNDEFSSSNDNNLPAASASLLGRFGTDGFAVGSVRYNRRTVGDIPALQDEDDISVSGGFHIVAGSISLGAGGIFTHTIYPTTEGPAQEAFGAHAQILFLVPGVNPIAIGYRFGVLDPSSRLDNDRVMEHTAGATLSVPRLRMRFQVQGVYIGEDRGLENARVQAAAEVAL